MFVIRCVGKSMAGKIVSSLKVGRRFISNSLYKLYLHARCCVFLFPKALCHERKGIMSGFWWQKSANSKGMHWCNLSTLSLPKDFGGIGFHDLCKFNLVLLAKQG